MTQDDKALAGQHVVVTGAAQGIGLAIADAFLAAGANVTIVGRDQQKLATAGASLQADHGTARVHEALADLTDADQIAAAFAAAVTELGPVAVLVNNAGASGSVPFAKMDQAHFGAMLDANALSTFLCCKAVIGDMLAAKSGRIINVASTAGLKGYAYVAGYCAGKHAVVGLTRSLALEVARKGITVNAICPGFVETPMTVESVRNIVEKTGRTEEQARADLAAMNPQKRLVQPVEIAAMAVQLALPTAGGINGQMIAIDGGETA
ncbi:MAG: SDR family NAD(P)-dependent oxidoreductase [Minwuia sp.]|nr:SDR family NAD(P)-dependent oxidoreductase [Minwuia sp.]